MDEIQLFYYQSVSNIRAVQASYLAKIKQVPFERELPEVVEVSAEEYAKMKFIQRLRYRRRLRKQKKAYKKALRRQKRPIDEAITNGYNAGIEMALKSLKATFIERMSVNE